MEKKLKHAIIFFIASFVWTWLFYFAIIAFGLNPYQGTGMVLLILGGCSPTFVGIIMALFTYSKEDRMDYLKRAYQVTRIRPLMWLFILLIFPVIYGVSIGIDSALGGGLPQMTNLKAVLASPLTFFPLILLSFLSGPFSEELGWRGFALDPLLKRYGLIRASVILGVIWAVWHLPLFLMPQTWHGQIGFGLTGFWAFMLMTVGLAGMMSWVYIQTERSILSAMLMHLASNFTGQLLEMVSPNVELFRSILCFVIGIGLCVFYGMELKGKQAQAERITPY